MIQKPVLMRNQSRFKIILISPSHLHLGLPSCLPRPPHQTQYAPLLSPIRATCATHRILVNLINQIISGKEYKAYSSLRTLLHSRYFVSLFSKTLSLCCALSVSNQVSHPYKMTGKITVLNILKFTLSVSKLANNHVFISGRLYSSVIQEINITVVFMDSGK